MSTTPANPSSELAIRTAVGVGLIALAGAALALGGLIFWILCCVAALFMLAEWSDLHGATPKQKRLAQFALSVPLAIMAPPSLIIENRDFFVLGLLAGAAVFTAVATKRRELALGVIYAGLPVLALTILRRQHEGLGWTLWALSLVWATDIGAYFAGRAIGGPKLAPRISPNKTWAGLIGGVAAAGVLGLAFHWKADLPWRMTLATPALAVLAQAGDLYESWLKRRAGVKDSGNLLPGHGGVMDRLDGLVVVAPVAALLMALPKLYA